MRAVLVLAVLLAFSWVIPQAYAYRPGGQRSTVPVTIAYTAGTSSATAIVADAQRSAWWICDESNTASIAWSHASFGAAALNGAGSITVGPLGCSIIDNTKDTDAINVISTGAATPVTIFTWD
jgi:hypothetical protein